MSLVKRLSLLAMVAVATPVFAGDVYVCEKNGRKEFSQLPCGDNAVVLKGKGEQGSLKISMPMTAKEATGLCKLVITAKDRSAQSRQKPARYNRYSRYHSYDYSDDRSPDSANNPQAYVLSHIENLELIATKSPDLYELIKGLVDNVYYQGYEISPVYEAERAAALSKCQDNVMRRLDYLDRY